MRASQWAVDIYISQKDDVTLAESRLRTRDATHLVGRGRAYRYRGEHLIPEVGEELAVARSLTQLGQQLFLAAYDDIEGVSGVPRTGEAVNR